MSDHTAEPSFVNSMILRQPFTGSVSVRICKGGGQQLSLPVDAVLVGYMVLVRIHDFWMWQVAAERRFDVVRELLNVS